MTTEQVEECVKEWQNRLMLKHWTIQLDWDNLPDKETSYADIGIPENRHIANIRFCKDFLDLDIETINEAIAHELTHCHLESIYDKTIGLVKNLSLETQETFKEIIKQEIELSTDALSIAFARHTPTPQCLVKKPRKKKTILDIIEE